MNILGIDLGTHCGIAFNGALTGAALQIQTIHFATPAEIKKLREERLDRRCDPRVVNCFKTIADIVRKHDIEAVVFEDVQFTEYPQAKELWTAYRTAAQLACLGQARLQTIECVPVSTLKKFATGQPSAAKCNMAASAVLRFSKVFPGYRTAGKGDKLFNEEKKIALDNNAIDAFWLWAWGQANLAKFDLTKLG